MVGPRHCYRHNGLHRAVAVSRSASNRNLRNLRNLRIFNLLPNPRITSCLRPSAVRPHSLCPLCLCSEFLSSSGEALTDLLRDELHVRGFLDRETDLGIHNVGKNRALVFGKAFP